MIWLTKVGGLATSIYATFKYLVGVFSIRIFSNDILGNLFLVKRLGKDDIKDESDDNSDDGLRNIRFVTKEEKKDYEMLKHDIKDKSIKPKTLSRLVTHIY